MERTDAGAADEARRGSDVGAPTGRSEVHCKTRISQDGVWRRAELQRRPEFGCPKLSPHRTRSGSSAGRSGRKPGDVYPEGINGGHRPTPPFRLPR